MEEEMYGSAGKDFLSKNRVTAGSRIILPVYPFLATFLGLLFICQSEDRTSGPAFNAAKDVMSITDWGLVFLALGVFKVAAFAARNKAWLRWALTLGAGLCGFWSVLLFWSAYKDPHVSYTSGLWVLFAMFAHIASVSSLANDMVYVPPRAKAEDTHEQS